MTKSMVIALIFTIIACVQCAPQFDQEFQQQQPERQSKYATVDSRFHQAPNLEYNFEWVCTGKKNHFYECKFNRYKILWILDKSLQTEKSTDKMADSKRSAAMISL